MNEPMKHPDQIASYFKAEIPLLIVITISGLIYNIGMAAGPYFEGQLVQCLADILQHKRSAAAMVSIAGWYVGVILLVQGMRAVKRFGVRRFANNTSRRMRGILYDHLIYTHDAAEDSGSLMTKAIADVDACAEGMRKFTTELFDTGVVMITYIVMLLHYDVRLTLLCCAFTPLAYLAADRLKVRVTAANEAYKQSQSSLNDDTIDRIEHALTYRLFGQEQNRNAHYEKALQDYETKSAAANLYESALAPLYDAIAMIGAVMVIYFGARNVIGTGWTAWNLAAFTTFLSCFTKLAVKTSHAANLFNAVQKAEVSWQRIRPFMAEPAADDFDPQHEPLQPAVLSWQDVSCGYQAPDQLYHVSFTARPGQIIGITGAVASGKTLIGKVLVDEAVYTGSITVNGQEFRSLSEAQKCCFFSYMGHDPELLDRSLTENIALGRSVDVPEYVHQTALDEDLKSMHKTAADSIGSQGSLLSGGQQARAALARTLAHSRSILVLDDPFASVDQQTETKILTTLRTRYQDRTILILSHRLYHFPTFDHVLFLHDGTASFADHETLMREQPAYRALFQKQSQRSDEHA
ncbi:ABC transporter transmembrane domain-containing protein [Catenisphaera adipataccumulans]|uniref:ABC-type multidrug transport system fused ATPase/permease subunit n=1 Tax=Catenisphaera adipataccumulans TaxID=700500 RepID=A0A7W8FWM2_9FIRM|nr:ABC transporter ATP-binding protein [Catenisphaera adipataccumulans]MBB5182077.1 ABC-type multidrug transport system fused ATPase/permease subunit [Catenisphaera adipataccumulans]